MTDPGNLKRKKAGASLVILNSDDSRGKEIPLRTQQIRIGRNPELATVVLSDSTVSRLHATIDESTDGVFYIKNEGGSQGTYVNGQEAPISGMRLKNDDVIELGDVRLLFVQQTSEQKPPSDPTKPGGEETEPDMRRRRAK